jgi:hypothetical protein
MIYRRTTMISKELIRMVKLSNLKSYQIAHKAGRHPSTLSRILCGIERVKDNDERVLKVGRVLGLPPENCFESTNEVNNETR